MTVTKDKTNCNGFGERLTEVIRRAQVTRESFAKDLGYGITALKSWIYEETSPNLQTILKICDKYKVNLEWLATGTGTIEIGSTLKPDGLSIKVYDVKLSAGLGCFATDENYIIGLNDFVPNGLPMEVLQNMNYDYDSLKLKVESLLLH